MISPQHQLYLDRMKAQVRDAVDLSQIPEWLCQNTAHPTKDGAKWTFKDHEYQIDLLRDTSDELVAQKCSQVGASELWIRLVLALSVLDKRITTIYVLPTTTFARSFAKSRIDPIITSSPALSELIDRDVDSSELKQIGNSFLHIKGSYGQGAAISVPAKALFQDEVDFCNQITLTTYNSRLGHSKPGEYFKRSFSTPTVPGYGINAMFMTSSQAFYGVKCPSCHDITEIDYMENVRIPGFDGNLITFEKEDLLNPSYDVSNPFLLCKGCRSVIPEAILHNPLNRQWVHKHPSRSVRGYQITPLDVPTINPMSRTISQIADYERKKDWVNFKVGQPYEDAETSFILQTLRNYVEGTCHFGPEDGDLSPYLRNTVFGLDVGKVSWFTVLQPEAHKLRVVYAERIRQDGDNYLGKRVNQLIKNFGCNVGVVDAGPDISVSKYLVDSNPSGKVWACYYSRTQAKAHLSNVTLNDAEQVVSAFRTGCLNELAKKMNSGYINLSRSPEMETILLHLGALKRVDQNNDLGEMVSYWHNTGDDHYGHSLNYASIAYKMMTEDLMDTPVIAVHPGIVRIKMKSGLEDLAAGKAISDPLSFGQRTG